jgi:cholinesterase
MLATIASILTVAAYAQSELLVNTDKGYVQGHYNALGVKEWMGIPYAKPPVGNLRWEYPQEAESWSSAYQANYIAPACAQVCKLPPGNCPDFSGVSEDCLYLTVMAPHEPSKDPAGYPVFFWIHGGAYEQGMGNAALYNGTNFAQKDVVTVVINYRLGAMGFLAAENMQGNYGHMDQRLAMKWTQKNIAAFGGNPNKVTIGGQSAGGMSVGAHLIGPGSAGLFQQAIMESNPLGLPFHERDSAAENANNVFEYLNCAINDVACMRTKTMDEILDAQNNAVKLNFQNLFINFLPFAPLVEPGGEIPEQPFYGLMQGKFPRVPILQGSVLDEGLMFVDELFTKPLSEASYKGTIAATFGKSNYPEIIKAYPFDLIEGSADGRDSLNVLATDLLFYCPLRNATRGHQAVALSEPAQPVFEYKFEHVMSFDCWGPDYAFCVNEVCHGSELPFVFNVFTDGVSVDYTPNPDEIQLTTDMSNGWSNFCTHGDPNKGLEIKKQYPTYGKSSDAIIVLNEPTTEVKSHQREKYCDMWDRMGYFY